MRQQSCAIENESAHRGEIVERAGKTLLLQEAARFGKNSLGLIPEREQTLFAPGAPAFRRCPRPTTPFGLVILSQGLLRPGGYFCRRRTGARIRRCCPDRCQ